MLEHLVFNILIDNTDDHDKNQVLLVRDERSGQLELAPAFDVLPSGQALGYQQMRVGADDADATIDNALSMSAQFGLKRDAAAAQAREVVVVVASWKVHFATAGVSKRDIAHHEAQIDRPFQREQREALARASRWQPRATGSGTRVPWLGASFAP